MREADSDAFQKLNQEMVTQRWDRPADSLVEEQQQVQI